MTDQHPDNDLLLALALDDVGDSDRESTLRHLAICQRCRNEYDAFSATIEQTLSATPIVEPSPGFDGRVLEAMGFDGTTFRPARERRWSRRHGWQLVAASVAVGLGLGAGAGFALSQDNDSSTQTAVAHGSSLWTATGDEVGTVTRSVVDGEPVIVVRVPSPHAGSRYLCLLRLEGGEQVRATAWIRRSERGVTWVIRSPRKPVAEVVLVSKNGAGPVWSSARL